MNFWGKKSRIFADLTLTAGRMKGKTHVFGRSVQVWKLEKPKLAFLDAYVLFGSFTRGEGWPFDPNGRKPTFFLMI